MDEISKWVFDLEAGIQADNEPAVDDSLDAVLRGQAVELWWRGDTLWLVSDEEEAKRLGQPRGQVYAAAEAAGSPLSPTLTWSPRFNDTSANSTGLCGRSSPGWKEGKPKRCAGRDQNEMQLPDLPGCR